MQVFWKCKSTTFHLLPSCPFQNLYPISHGPLASVQLLGDFLTINLSLANCSHDHVIFFSHELSRLGSYFLVYTFAFTFTFFTCWFLVPNSDFHPLPPVARH